MTTVVILVFLFAGEGRAAEDYLVGEGDVLKITVYDHPDLNMEVRVSGGGVISFPLIGEVRVGGLTVARVGDIIGTRLADGYIIDPQLTVFIKEFRSKRTTIMGEVRNPGLYELHGQTSFLELLSKAGGLTPDAGDRATIKRKGTSGSDGGVITVDLKKLVREGNTTLDVIIADGDSVYVSEAGVFFIRGEVRRPASYRLEGEISVIKAITLAGGFTDEAARDRVAIMRASGGGEGILRVGEGDVSFDTPIERGDTIYVPKAGVFYVTGEVKKAGSYAFEVGTTLFKAITVAGGFTDKAAKGRIHVLRVVDGEERKIKKIKLDTLVEPGDVVVVPESFF